MIKPETNIEVAVALPVHGTFSYAVPNSISFLIEPGKRILVPFGRRRVTGYVLGTSTHNIDKPLKKILDILDDEPLFAANMVPFFKWIADYYIYPIGPVIQNALPGGLTAVEKNILTITPQGARFLKHGILTPIEKQILSRLQTKGSDLKDLQKKIDQTIPAASIFALLDRKLLATKKTLKGDRTRRKTERFATISKNSRTLSKLSKSRQKIIDYLESTREASFNELKKILPTAPR
ncbi:MAG: primosomal protein N', partial [Deltaproteobacteria bacterium]|nr:primosomal protein N' [Deltaproteobacteria bacterium]